MASIKFDYTFSEFLECDDVKITKTDKRDTVVTLTFENIEHFSNSILMHHTEYMLTRKPMIGLNESGIGLDTSELGVRCVKPNYGGYSHIKDLLDDMTLDCALHVLAYYAKYYAKKDISLFGELEFSAYLLYSRDSNFRNHHCHRVLVDWFNERRSYFCSKAYLRDDLGKRIYIVIELVEPIGDIPSTEV